MKHYKSERLKKLESELQDLEQWMKLGLVPKRDVKRHKEEILALQQKIEEEKERLQFLKESGEFEEYVTPKKTPVKPAGYTEMPTIPDIEGAETALTQETTVEMEAEYTEEATVVEDKEEATIFEEEEESYFSDKRRWRRGARGGIVDPDANEW